MQVELLIRNEDIVKDATLSKISRVMASDMDYIINGFELFYGGIIIGKFRPSFSGMFLSLIDRRPMWDIRNMLPQLQVSKLVFVDRYAILVPCEPATHNTFYESLCFPVYNNKGRKCYVKATTSLTFGNLITK